MTKIITDNTKVNENLILQNEILEAKIIRLLSEKKVLTEKLKIYDVANLKSTLPNLTLKQAIAKAKPNLDKIKDVDKHIEGIRTVCL